jgi:radical SAM protein with 4Fe4S-binding SPASM domain
MTGASVGRDQARAEERAGEIAVKAERLRIPLTAMVELTYRCNQDCVHCYCQHLQDTGGRAELRTDEWKRVLDELADLGTLHLAITGGEPLVRSDLWEITQHAKARHFSLTLFTNGTLLTVDAADRLRELRPTAIEMSLLGATERTHDRLTRTAGSWRALMRAADLLGERGLPFVFKTTLMRGNLHEQRELERVATAHGCRVHRWGTDISARNDGDPEPTRHRIGPRHLFAYYISPVGGQLALPEPQADIELSRQKSVCAAGVTTCAVNPYGQFLPCLQLLVPFGLVRERGLREMWEHPPEPIRRLRRTLTYGDVPACHACDLIDYCRRCHGLAQLETGDWTACDTMARHMALVARALLRYRRRADTGRRRTGHGASGMAKPRVSRPRRGNAR